jgi:hypothetical protein
MTAGASWRALEIGLQPFFSTRRGSPSAETRRAVPGLLERGETPKAPTRELEIAWSGPAGCNAGGRHLCGRGERLARGLPDPDSRSVGPRSKLFDGRGPQRPPGLDSQRRRRLCGALSRPPPPRHCRAGTERLRAATCPGRQRSPSRRWPQRHRSQNLSLNSLPEMRKCDECRLLAEPRRSNRRRPRQRQPSMHWHVCDLERDGSAWGPKCGRPAVGHRARVTVSVAEGMRETLSPVKSIIISI